MIINSLMLEYARKLETEKSRKKQTNKLKIELRNNLAMLKTCLSKYTSADVNLNVFNMEILRASLFKTYSAIVIHQVKWNEILLSFSAPVKALSSLSDQLDCVLKAKPCELSSKFPFLKGRLEQIIRALMEEEITAMLLLM